MALAKSVYVVISLLLISPVVHSISPSSNTEEISPIGDIYEDEASTWNRLSNPISTHYSLSDRKWDRMYHMVT